MKNYKDREERISAEAERIECELEGDLSPTIRQFLEAAGTDLRRASLHLSACALATGEYAECAPAGSPGDEDSDDEAGQ